MVYNKMNKTRHCAGRLCASTRLKCKNEFTILKKSFFQPIMKFFGTDSVQFSMSTKLNGSMYINWLIGQVGRVFINGPGDLGSISGRVIPKTFKMVLDPFLLNTQRYKVRIKGKVEQYREMSSAPPKPRCSSYRKGNLLVTFDYGRQLYIYKRSGQFWEIHLPIPTWNLRPLSGNLKGS